MRPYIALLFLGIGFAQSQPPSPTPPKGSQVNQQPRATDQGQIRPKDERSKDDTVIINNQFPAPPQNGAEKDSHDKTKGEPRIELGDISTRLLAVFTFLLVVVAVLQWLTMRGHERALTLMAKNMRRGLRISIRQTRITNIAALAAKKSAEVSEKALKLTQRADLLLDASSIVGPSGKFPGVVASSCVVTNFKNYGPTRADNVVFKVNLDIPGVPNAEQSLGPGVLGAGDIQAIRFASFGDFLSGATMSDINTGKCVMRIKGIVTYSDVFGEPHEFFVNSRYNARTRTFRAQEQQNTEEFYEQRNADGIGPTT
jgi:hypothetical protein